MEGIKTSRSKDDKIKYRARRAINLINDRLDKINIIVYDRLWDSKLTEFTCLDDNNDSRIIVTAITLKSVDKDVVFHTSDINCKCLAYSCELNVDYEVTREN